jgi:transitional endoplasmic reticulum ATPase
VIVFDEFDSIASRRSGREDGGSRAGNAIVAQLLTELDGFRPEVPVLVIGTTNRLDIIDEALLRPSRFRPVHIDLPDETARRAIAMVHAKHFGVPVSPSVLERIALATAGMNGDEIRSVFRDAGADALIGDPPKPVTPRRLGELVGALRRAGQERDVSRSQRGAAPARAPGTAIVMTPIDTSGAATPAQRNGEPTIMITVGPAESTGGTNIEGVHPS